MYIVSFFTTSRLSDQCEQIWKVFDTYFDDDSYVMQAHVVTPFNIQETG